MQDEALRQLLDRYRRGTCTPEEERQVERWYESLGQEREEVELDAEEHAELSARLWRGIERRIGQPEPVVRRIDSPRRWLGWVAAAALVLSCGLAAIWLVRSSGIGSSTTAQRPAPHRWVTRHNTTRNILQITLQDSSVIQLYPNSTLSYPRRFVGTRRVVSLRGEAFFQVSHDAHHPFQVVTPQVVTTVLGTSFTIRAFEDQPEAQVMVRTGKVRVTPRAHTADLGISSKASVVLLPNQQVVYRPEGQRLRKELVDEPQILEEQPILFNDKPVAEVVAALEKAYGVQIHYDKAVLANCTVTLNLRAPSLYDKLNVLCKAIGATYEVEGTRVELHAKGCAKSG